MDHYNFDELNQKADITTLQRISGNPRTVRTAAGTELHDVCPFTGEGNDRFWINIDRQPMTWNCRRSCPDCSRGGDAMQFIAMREHLNRKQDGQKIAAILAAEIGISPERTLCNVSRTPAAIPQKKEPPRNLTAPGQQWQKIAGNIVMNAYYTLQNGKTPEALEALDYLHKRGITDKMIDRYKIGYIPTIPKYFGYNVNLADGTRYYKALTADEKNNAAWVPEGITIPRYLDGQLFSVKVRKLNRRAKDKAEAYNQYQKSKAAAAGKPEPKEKTDHDFRYEHIGGTAGSDTGLFNGDAAIDMHPLHDVIFVEGELDALLINSIMFPVDGDTLQAVTFGSASLKNVPFQKYFRYFNTPERIVICYDNDAEGQAGAAVLYDEISKLKTRETPPVLVTLPEGYKDFGEYYAAGGNVYELLCKWFPV